MQNSTESNDYIHVWEANLHIIVPRGTSWAEIEKRIQYRKDYLAHQEIRKHYLSTHGPWNFPMNKCYACGNSLTYIHYNRSLCNGNAEAEARKE